MTAKTAEIVIRPVVSKSDVRAFVGVPHALYQSDPNYVPQLDMERADHLSPAHNPYFEHADAQLFTAERGGTPIGRISAQVDRLRLERHGDRTGQFGFIEAVDDSQVFGALFAAAEDWLIRQGMNRALGPFSFSINQEAGLLIDGFDMPPSIMMGHAPPYYGGRIEALGYRKAKDVIAYDHDGLAPLPRPMNAMVQKAVASGDMTIRSMSKKNLDRDLDIIIDIFNDAWSDNWEFVPMTGAEIGHLGKNLKMLVSEGYIAIADWQGEPAAMAVSLPDLNRWIGDLNGKLLPIGWAKLAWRMFTRSPAAVRIPLMGVRKQHQSSPVGAALAIAVIDAVRAYHLAHGTTRAELSWVLEDNVAMRRIIESLGAKPYKTYRIYEKSI